MGDCDVTGRFSVSFVPVGFLPSSRFGSHFNSFTSRVSLTLQDFDLFFKHSTKSATSVAGQQINYTQQKTPEVRYFPRIGMNPGMIHSCRCSYTLIKRELVEDHTYPSHMSLNVRHERVEISYTKKLPATLPTKIDAECITLANCYKLTCTSYFVHTSTCQWVTAVPRNEVIRE